MTPIWWNISTLREGDGVNIYGLIGLVCLALAVGLTAVALTLSRRQHHDRQSLKEGKRRASSFFITFYSQLLLVPFLKENLLSIRKRLEIYTESDERIIRKRSVTLLLATILLVVAVVCSFWIITRDWLLLILFTILLSFIADTVVEIFIHNLQNRILKQQVRYIELLHHKYYEQKSVEDANYEACNVLNQKGTFEVYFQAERINDILTSSEIETELEKYYETAPNKYFKMLAGILYITKEYGDTQVQGSSVFIRCITYLGSEIKAELYKREKLKYALRSLNVIAILPLFFIKPLRNWASGSFAPLENFYSSKSGIILGIITILLSVISYMTLGRLQNYDRAAKAGFANKTLEQKLYTRGLYKIVDRMVPQEYTLKKNKLIELIKNAMTPLNIYTLYTRRLLIGCAAFLFGLGIILGLNAYTRHKILYLPQMPQGYLGGQLSSEELVKLQTIADQDRTVILKLGIKADDEAISDEIMKNETKDEEEAESSILRIKSKMQQLSINIFWWWQLLICVGLFGTGYYSPIINLRFIAEVRKIDMEEEVSQFQTIILMLMHMNRVHVEEILEWMETFSVHFKEPLQKCLSNFSAGPFEALEELKSDVAFPPFISIVENLQLACEDLGVARAFEELESEMTFNRETRKDSNERIVERKKNLGNLIGFLPVYAIILLYLIIPMIVSGMESISAFYQQLSQL